MLREACWLPTKRALAAQMSVIDFNSHTPRFCRPNDKQRTEPARGVPSSDSR